MDIALIRENYTHYYERGEDSVVGLLFLFLKNLRRRTEMIQVIAVGKVIRGQIIFTKVQTNAWRGVMNDVE